MKLPDRMKLYESGGTTSLMPLLPICVRLDGRAFHSWTRGMDRPFDESLHRAFDRTMVALVHESSAVIGYTQSDEITLIIHSDDFRSQTYFNGKAHKIGSVLSSLATAVFNAQEFSHKASKPALFDARVWTVPNLDEAANVLLWREEDAIRNSVQALAQSRFSPRQLHRKSVRDCLQMLQDEGVYWTDECSERQQRGAYAARRMVFKELTPEVLAKIPEGKRPDGPIERHEIQILDLPPLRAVENRVEVLFRGAIPLVVAEKMRVYA